MAGRSFRGEGGFVRFLGWKQAGQLVQAAPANPAGGVLGPRSAARAGKVCRFVSPEGRAPGPPARPPPTASQDNASPGTRAHQVPLPPTDCPILCCLQKHSPHAPPAPWPRSHPAGWPRTLTSNPLQTPLCWALLEGSPPRPRVCHHRQCGERRPWGLGEDSGGVATRPWALAIIPVFYISPGQGDNHQTSPHQSCHDN